MSIEPEQQLLHYRMIEKIGEGGMGVVWKARDTILDREVAIKILPAEFAEDAERLARFEREAKLLASLNHPNIATIHGLHATGAVRFLAMELVAGQDLTERLSAGPMALAEALAVARQIAEALEAAHESGIVHRDLKPANIRLTTDGQIKVLDFGLARGAAKESGPGSASMSPTITSMGTQAGMILGTAAYMSPEQAKGHAVDRRADIWAFGVVLFEMLAGGRLFDGGSISEVLAAVLMKEPDWLVLPADVPTPVRNLLRRCLRRDARSRLRDIGDARVAIEETIGGATIEDEVPVAVEPGRPRSRWLVHLLWVALLVLVAVVATIVSRDVRPPSPVVRFAVAGSTPLGPGNPMISPDGTKVAYTEGGSLWVRDLDRIDPRKLADSVVTVSPFWSPDSARIGYSSNDKLLTIAAGGGDPTTVCDTPDVLQAGTWGADGKIRFALENGPIREVTALGGDPRITFELTGDERDFQSVHMLPDDRGLLLSMRLPNLNGAIAVGTGAEKRTLVQKKDQWIDGPVYSDTGHLLYYRAPDNPGIWAAPFSLSTLEITGEPFLVVPDGRWPGVSHNGTLTYLPGSSSGLQELVLVDREGQVLSTIGQQQDSILLPTIAPDGRVAVSAMQQGRRSLWLHDAASGAKSQLTFTEGTSYVARWVTGNEILFGVRRPSEGPSIYRMPVDRGAEPVKVVDGSLDAVSKDGRYLVYGTENEETGQDIRYRTLDDGEREDAVFVGTPHDEHRAVLSPDGRWLVYVSDESGREEVYLKRFPSGEGKWLVATGSRALFDPRGDRLYVATEQGLVEVPFVVEPSVSLGPPRTLFIGTGLTLWRGFDVSSDGQSFVAVRNAQSEGEDDVPRAIMVVQNWFEEFRAASR